MFPSKSRKFDLFPDNKYPAYVFLELLVLAVVKSVFFLFHKVDAMFLILRVTFLEKVY